MARFHPLEVTDVRKTLRDAVVVTLKPVNGGDFDFTQGQYLTFKRDFDGTEIRRSYSICAGKDMKLSMYGHPKDLKPIFLPGIKATAPTFWKSLRSL